jgi:hypothetical protein
MTTKNDIIREDGFMPILKVTSYRKIAAEKTSYILPVHF